MKQVAKEYKPVHGGRAAVDLSKINHVRYCLELNTCTEAIYVNDYCQLESDSIYAAELASICQRLGSVILSRIEFEAPEPCFQWPGTFYDLVAGYSQWFEG